MADRKFTYMYGGESKYGNKIFGVFRNVIFATAGSEDMTDIFVKYVLGEATMLRDLPKKYTSDNFFHKIKETITKLIKVRNGAPFSFEAVVARQFPNGDKSDLHAVNYLGDKKQVVAGYVALGSGKDVALSLLKEHQCESMTMKQFSELAYWTIVRVGQQEESVGLGGDHPMISYLENGALIDTAPSDEELEEMKQMLNKSSILD